MNRFIKSSILLFVSNIILIVNPLMIKAAKEKNILVVENLKRIQINSKNF